MSNLKPIIEELKMEQMEPFLQSPKVPFQANTRWMEYRAQVADCQRRDKIKFDYCQQNNIPLYYITYEEIIEDRLEEIMNEQFATNN